MDYTQLIWIAIQFAGPLIAPFVTKLVSGRIPVSARPALNAVLGAAIAGLAGGNEAAVALGATTSHVLRSGLVHETPTTTEPAMQRAAPLKPAEVVERTDPKP
jgi:hypothetical protein